MRYKGVITPRDNYYEVILNGKKLGLMYFEERYTEQLTEYYKKPLDQLYIMMKKQVCTLSMMIINFGTMIKI